MASDANAAHQTWGCRQMGHLPMVTPTTQQSREARACKSGYGVLLPCDQE